MARFNEILVGRYNRLFQKLLSMKGSAAVVQLASEIQPAFTVFHGAENRYLESWERFGLAMSVAAVAANTSCVRIRNPLNSNVIGVIEKIDVSEVAADINLILRKGTGAVTDLAVLNNTAGTNFDERGRTAPTCQISTQNSAPGAPAIGGTENSIWAASIAANVVTPLIGTDIQELPLTPGDAYQINCGSVNQRLIVNLWWRERFLEDSERT